MLMRQALRWAQPLPVALALLSSWAAVSTPRACTTFCLAHEGEWLFGSNLDWNVEDGLVLVNKRGVAKEALGGRPPATWVSRYASITFNQYGREMPMGGMNEAGLVIDTMWLESTEYPGPDGRFELPELQWVQYQLDTAASVAEVVASYDRVCISRAASSPLHFLACDRDGACASIEFLGGEMIVHMGEALPVEVLTNHPYSEALAFYGRCAGDTASAAFRAASYSLKRFCRAAQGVADYRPAESVSPVDYAFGILDKVAVARTQWRIVYDPAHGRIHFRTRSNPARRHADLGMFELTCETPVQVLDLQVGGPGDVSAAFVDYTTEANLDLIRSAYAQTSFLRERPEASILALARLPERFRCLSRAVGE